MIPLAFQMWELRPTPHYALYVTTIVSGLFAIAALGSLVPRPLSVFPQAAPSFSMMHAEKREGLESEIT